MLLLSTPYPKIKRDVLEQLADRLATETEQLGVALQQAIPKTLSRWQRQQLEVRAELLDSAELHGRLPVQRLLSAYVEQTDLEQGIEDSAFSRQQVEDRLQTIRAFVRFMASTRLPACDALDYLRQLQQQQRAQAADASRTANSGQSLNGVQLTSIHKSKGLEWHTVIIPGLNGHYFPYQPEGEFASPPSEESERRLLYVAITRARQQLHLIVPPPCQPRPDAASDTIARELPSRFETELNIANCQRLSRAIEQDNRSVTHMGATAPWLPEYCQKTGNDLQIREKQPPVQVATVASAPRAKRSSGKSHQSAGKATARVRHKTLGEGRVIQDKARYWVIHFDADNRPRTLDKSLAGPMLTWLTG